MLYCGSPCQLSKAAKTQMPFRTGRPSLSSTLATLSLLPLTQHSRLSNTTPHKDCLPWLLVGNHLLQGSTPSLPQQLLLSLLLHLARTSPNLGSLRKRERRTRARERRWYRLRRRGELLPKLLLLKGTLHCNREQLVAPPRVEDALQSRLSLVG